MNSFPELPLVEYEAFRPEIQSGDILLASGQYMFSRLIQKATGSCFSHVAFVMRLDEIDRVMVLESIEGKGVRTIPLSEYTQNFEGSGRGYKGRLALVRHQEFAAKATAPGLRSMAQFAVDRLARPYDEEEIARITARIVAGALGFAPDEVQRNDEYICSEYVWECYARLGITVPHDPRGFIAPADFARAAHMQWLCELRVKA